MLLCVAALVAILGPVVVSTGVDQIFTMLRAPIVLGSPITVVMGNEAADLDSVVSAILYATLLSESTINVKPVINIPRGELFIRRDVSWVLEEIIKIPIDELLFIDEIDLNSLMDFKLILVDHNRLSSHQEALLPSIVEIIDHHESDGIYANTTRVDIRKVGSCCTMVTERFESVDGALSLLALGPIVIDTNNIDGTKFYTELDVNQMHRLQDAGKLSDEDLVAYLNELQTRRSDMDGMSTSLKLKKDCKIVRNVSYGYAVSSIPQSVEELSMDPMFLPEIEKFVSDKAVDFLVINTIIKIESTLFRENLFYFVTKESQNVIIKALLDLNQVDNSLQLEPKGLVSKQSARFDWFQQLNTISSRKQLIPFINAAISTINNVFTYSFN